MEHPHAPFEENDRRDLLQRPIIDLVEIGTEQEAGWIDPHGGAGVRRDPLVDTVEDFDRYSIVARRLERAHGAGQTAHRVGDELALDAPLNAAVDVIQNERIAARLAKRIERACT